MFYVVEKGRKNAAHQSTSFPFCRNTPYQRLVSLRYNCCVDWFLITTVCYSRRGGGQGRGLLCFEVTLSERQNQQTKPASEDEVRERGRGVGNSHLLA